MNTGRVEPKGENWSVAVGIGATAAIWTYTVPPKTVFRWKSFGNYLGTVAAWGVAYWIYTVNGVRKEFAGTDPLMDQIGYAAQRQPVNEDEVGGGSVIQFLGVNPTAAILNMGVSLGWELIHQE